MKNRITQLFKTKNSNILSIYFTAGYPSLNDTVPAIEYLDEAGVDIIEVGFPFSDPLADGPVIQQSSKTAIDNGMTLKLLFEQLGQIRKQTDIPLVLMGYLNPVLQFGEDKFIEACVKTGIDGVIIPDMPVDYYCENLKEKFVQSNVSNIFLITPQTPDEKARFIDDNTSGFIYMVSSDSITGSNKNIESQASYLRRINNLQLKNPKLTGFGIHNMETFEAACKYSNGAIIGSAFIKHISEKGLSKETVLEFIKTIKP